MTKFKVGDKVRVIREHIRDCMANVKIGGTATILGNFDGDHYRVEYENNYGGTNKGYALPKSIELISESTEPKYRTEKRKANVGERILITGKYDYAMNDMTVGNIYEVVEDGFNGDYVNVIDDEGEQASAQDGYYEVIIEAKPSKNERISLLESQVAELQAKVEALEKKRKPAVALTKSPSAHYAETYAELGKQFMEGITAGLITKPTPNEQRKAVIERAKAFVKDTINEYQLSDSEISFEVDAKKRSVSVTLSHLFSGKTIVKAIAKCAPDDVFNADIGKAIALGRALGLDVSEFENAVKPTEAVIGQRVRYAGGRSIRKVTKEYENYATNSAEFVNRKIVDYDIIDDTEAQY